MVPYALTLFKFAILLLPFIDGVYHHARIDYVPNDEQTLDSYRWISDDKRERSRFFDEYLLSIKIKTPEPIFLPEPNELYEGDVTTNSDIQKERRNKKETQKPYSSTSLTSYEIGTLERLNRYGAPLKYSCCFLGQVAGNHGFHCNVQFYESRVQIRETSRSQMHQSFINNPESGPLESERLLQTFDKCVRKHAASFHHCCYATRLLGSESIDTDYYLRHRSIRKYN